MKAGFYDFAVEQHGAGATFADHATDVSAGEADIFAEKMRQQDARFDIFFVEPAVDSHADGLFHEIGE
jgi:hypothetical protein